jgi:hypothetical protein
MMLLLSVHKHLCPPSQGRRHQWAPLAVLGVLVLALSACGTTGAGGSTSTPISTSTPQSTPVPFSVTSVDLSVTPTSIAGTTCGSSATFTYTATFHVAADSAGGTIQFAYTLNNGRSQTPGTVTVAAGQTSATYTFTSSGTLPPDHTYPGVAIVMVTSPNSVLSTSVQPSGTCM